MNHPSTPAPARRTLATLLLAGLAVAGTSFATGAQARELGEGLRGSDRLLEVGDDRGRGREIGDDRGRGRELGDDRGRGREVGDDRGRGREPGDDRGGRRLRLFDDNGRR